MDPRENSCLGHRQLNYNLLGERRNYYILNMYYIVHMYDKLVFILGYQDNLFFIQEIEND